jgi:hypothetical protein
MVSEEKFYSYVLHGIPLVIGLYFKVQLEISAGSVIAVVYWYVHIDICR